MAKQKDKLQELKKELNALLVKRSIENTDKYNEEIKNLEAEINFFEYGI